MIKSATNDGKNGEEVQLILPESEIRPPAYQAHYLALERATFLKSKPAMHWLIRFAQVDLTQWQGERLRRLRYQVARFAQWLPGFQSTGTTTLPWNWTGTPGQARLVSELTPEEEVDQRRLPSSTTLRELQRTIADDLAGFLTSGEVDYILPPGRMRLMYNKQRERVVEVFYRDRSDEDRPEVLFRYHSAKLLAKHGQYLRRCPCCQRFFLAYRRDQAYCCRQCQSRHVMRLIRNTPPERYRDKRGRPPKAKLDKLSRDSKR